MIEVLCPAGDLTRLKWALMYGADAVYIGGYNYSLRANANNFSMEEIKEAVKIAHELNKKVYVTVNILFHNKDLEGLSEYLKELSDIGIDAYIVSDMAVIKRINELKLKPEIHISTQESSVNYLTVKFWEKLGATRVVLGRECSKEDIINIMNKFNLEETTIKKVSDYLDNFGRVITDYIKGNSKDVITVTTEVATSLIAIISKAVIAIVFAIYIIAQKETLKRQFNKLMSAYLKPRTVNRINKYASMANTTFSNFVTGQCLEALIFGSLCFLGMLILRLPYATTIAVLLGFTALIPVFGAFIGTFLGAFLILMISPIKAIIFVVFILVLQQIEGNLIYPKVVGKSVGLPGIWVLLSVTIGASVGGILGMLIATPLCSLLYILLRQAVNDRINSNKIVNRVKEKV